MRKLTILHVESHDQWAGQERRVVSECAWMRQRGHRVHLAATPGTPVFERAQRAGVQVHPARFRNPDLPAAVIRIRGLIRRLRPDVLNPHGNRDAKATLLAAWGMGVPCVIRSRHSTIPIKNRLHNRYLYDKLCHFVLTTSSQSAEQIIRDLEVPRERVLFIPSGISPPKELPGRKLARRQICEEFNIPKSDFWIGFIGRITQEKGLEYLISAFEKTLTHCNKIRLFLIGKGKREEIEIFRNFAKKRESKKRIIFTGFRENPWGFHRAMDLEVMPSLNEGVSQSILEGMYANCPIIGSNVGGIPDIVIHKKTGLLFSPGNANELANAIVETMSRPKESIRRAKTARRMVEENHTIDVMGRNLLEIYESAINSKARL